MPNITHNAPIQPTARIAPQPFPRPAQVSPPHIISGQIGSASPPAVRATQIAPTSQAARAFGLAGVHQFGSRHVIRNPFFANRPALAHATFHGRFAQFARRHHHRFGPIIVVGFIGPLFWPYAYDDFLEYTFYPYAYDAFWPYAYEDVYSGIIGVYGPGIGPASARSGTESGYVCIGKTAGVTDWRIDDIAKTVEADDLQRAALDELRTAMTKALDILKGTCPTNLPSTPTGRLETMSIRVSAMLEAVRTVRPALDRFYQSLDDEQKTRFNAIAPAGDQAAAAEDQRDLTKLCSERSPGIADLPIDRIAQVVQPTAAQQVLLDELKEASAKAAVGLKSDCPTYQTLTPTGRVEAMERRLEVILVAVKTVQPALANFYKALNDEQKARFNTLSTPSRPQG
jgi:LTXXQ motif family protein